MTYAIRAPPPARVRPVADDGPAAAAPRASGVRRPGSRRHNATGLEGLRRRLLGLERLERAERAPELGHRRAAVAQASRSSSCRCRRGSGRGRPRRCQRRSANSSTSMRSARANRQAATATRRASTICNAPMGASSATSAASKGGELKRILVRQHDEFLRAHAVLERILRRARLAFGGVRPARLCAVLPAGFGAGIADGDGRATRGACTGHRGGDPWLERADGSRWEGVTPQEAAPGSDI